MTTRAECARPSEEQRAAHMVDVVVISEMLVVGTLSVAPRPLDPLAPIDEKLRGCAAKATIGQAWHGWAGLVEVLRLLCAVRDI